MDKIKLLNSVFINTDGVEKNLSPSDIVINCFDEFMIMTNYIGLFTNKIYISNLIYNKSITFIIPKENLCESINFGTPMNVQIAEKQYMVIPDILADDNCQITINRIV